MSDARQAEALIARLSEGLRPVRRLPPAWRRAALWLGASVWLTGMLALFTDVSALVACLGGAPDMWLAAAGAVLTAILAAIAAHLTSIPGRSPRWAALPLPPLLLWIGASAAGCLRGSPIPARPEGPMHPMACFYFIVLAAAPLAALLTAQMRRAYPVRPRLTGTLAGLASAAASASLLTLIHPFDASARDLAMHFLAVGLIVVFVRQLYRK